MLLVPRTFIEHEKLIKSFNKKPFVNVLNLDLCKSNIFITYISKAVSSSMYICLCVDKIYKKVNGPYSQPNSISLQTRKISITDSVPHSNIERSVPSFFRFFRHLTLTASPDIFFTFFSSAKNNISVLKLNLFPSLLLLLLLQHDELCILLDLFDRHDHHQDQGRPTAMRME